MKAIILHDIYTEDVIGTVLLKPNVDISEVCEAWGEYQEYNNSNLDSEADIHEFAYKNHKLCEPLEMDFYQP